MDGHIHTEYFLRCRNKRLNQIVDPTNNLIIRLDKLINDFKEFSEGNRKDFEKRVVPWSENLDFPNCSVCAIKFSITKRKHHCRLCGKIICQACSKFLAFESAKKLIGSDFSNHIFDEIEKTEFATANKRRGSMSSSSSINSMKTTTEKFGFMLINSMNSFAGNGLISNGDPSAMNMHMESGGNLGSLRICGICKSLLERREDSMGVGTANSVFLDLYQKLHELLIQISNLSPSYRRMVEKLWNFETTYSLESAGELRNKIISIQREITSISERIENWGLTEDPLFTRKPTVKEIMLQKNIRIFAITSLQTAIADIPELPSEENYKELCELHKERIRIAELEKAQQLQVQSSQQQQITKGFSSNPALTSFIREKLATPFSAFSTSPSSSQNYNQINHFFNQSSSLKQSSSLTGFSDDGWAPEITSSNSPHSNNPFEESSSLLEELHPLQLQYLNIHNFLKQAAQSGRLNDIEILERNLHEMENELKRNDLSIPIPRVS